MTIFTESVVEKAALAWLEAIGWRIAHGPDIAPDMPAPERPPRNLSFSRPRTLRSADHEPCNQPTAKVMRVI